MNPQPNELYVSMDYTSSRVVSPKTRRLFAEGWVAYDFKRGYALFRRPKRVAYLIRQQEKVNA